VEILHNIDIEIAALCLAGLVLVQLAVELRRLHLNSQETPPRVIRLKRKGEGTRAQEAEFIAKASTAVDLSDEGTIETGSATERWV